MNEALHAVAWVLLGAALLPSVYLGFLALIAWRGKALEPQKESLKFAVLVPSHNEEASIVATVEGLKKTEYPLELFDVVVIADNCSDRTAELARDAGAYVLERSNDELKGKGYALEFAFETLGAEDSDLGTIDAFVVVDADTLVTPNLLTAFAARIERGAHAVQAEYGVQNPEDSWRTRLMVIALALFHRLRNEARERMHLSVGLRGNGMCFRRELLVEVPHRSYGLTEDVEYGLMLGMAGYRVWYAGEAEVLGEMVSSGRAAESQRRRWEGGRFELAVTWLPKLLWGAVSRASLVLADLAMDILVPPLSYVVALIGLGAVGEGVLWYFRLGHLYRAAGWGLCGLAILLYVARGVQLSGMGWRGWAILARAPGYMLWKFAVALPWKRDRGWVRTQREAEQGAEDTQRLHE